MSNYETLHNENMTMTDSKQTNSNWTDDFTTSYLIKTLEADLYFLSEERTARDIKRSIIRDKGGALTASMETLAAIKARLESE